MLDEAICFYSYIFFWVSQVRGSTRLYNLFAIVNALHIHQRQAVLAVVLALTPVSLKAVPQATPKSPASRLETEAVPPASPRSHRCDPEDYGILDLPETKALIADYGFEPFLPGKCLKAEVPWAKTATVMRLRAVSEQVDDNRELTLLRASPSSRVWLIPIINGMVGYAHTPDNPHNLAALNDLLRILEFRAADGQIVELSNLYQFIVGMEMTVNPDDAPKKLKKGLTVSELRGEVEHNGGFIDFTHREPLGDSWTGTYLVWEFRYTADGGYTRLVDVDRKTLKEYNK